MARSPKAPTDGGAQAILRRRREAAPDDRLAHLIKDATRGLTRALQMRLAEHGVAFGHWLFLRILWERDGITQRDLSERAGLMEPTTHAALLAMARLGYVDRRRQSDSRKKVYVFLTPIGRGLRGRLVPLAEEVNAVAVRGVDPATIAATRDMLLAMIDNLAADEATQLLAERRIPPTRERARRIQKAKPAKPSVAGRTGRAG